MKQFFPVLIVLTIFLTGGIWWFQHDDAEQTDIQSVGTAVSDGIEGALPDERLETDEEHPVISVVKEPTARGVAKNIVHVPDVNAGASEPEQEAEPESEFKKDIKKLLGTSLEGAVEDSVNLARLMNQCGSIPGNDAQVQNLLQTTQEKFRPDRKWGFGGGQKISFESFQDYEIYLRQKYDQCHDIRSIFTRNLHGEIAKLAAGGNRIARYLYAMWPPSLGGKFRINQVPEWLEYQNRALEYTWQNIHEDEPLGLLAFGQSFADQNGGFFTPTNFRYSQVFFLAAEKCGLKSNWLESETSKYIVDLSKGIVGSKLNRIEMGADEIKELFCN